jgi:hypothetical protein
MSSGDPRDTSQLDGAADPASNFTHVVDGPSVGDGTNPTGFDLSGFGIDRSCPAVPSIVVLGQGVDFPQVWCGLLSAMGALCVLGAMIVGVKILGYG